jgi:hypothetical protein
MVHRVELVRCRVGHDHDAALAHQRHAAVEVEVVPQPEAHHEDRVHDRVDVVRPDERDAHRQDVGLALHLDELLLVDVLGGDLVHRLDLAALDAGHLVRRFDRLEDVAGDARRRPRQRLGRGDEHRPVARRPLPLALVQEPERRREDVGVERGLDLEHVDAGVDEHLAHAPVALVQLAAVLVHEAAAVRHGVRVVVVAQAAVAGQPGGRRLPAAVHRDQVDVDVDQQVALGGPLVHLDLFAVRRLAEVGQLLRVLGVVLVQQTARGECVVHAVADGVAQFGLGHPSVQGEGGDDVHVVDATLGGEVEHGLDDALADVGAAHLRQRQADVVERDRQLHAGEQQLRERVLVDRVQQRMTDRAVDVVERLEWLRGVDDARAVRRQLLEAEPLAAPEQGRWRVAIDVEDETWSRHYFSSLMSKTTLTAPRGPALAAWAMASA